MPPPLPPSQDPVAERLDRPIGRRAALLGVLLVFTPVVVWLLAPLLRVDGVVRGLLAASFPVVVIVGYQLWWIRIMAVGARSFGRRLKSGSLLPTPEEARQLAIRTLDAASIFRPVARVAALLVGLAVAFAGHWVAALVVLVLLIGWGQWLAAVGVAGWLPIPEGE